MVSRKFWILVFKKGCAEMITTIAEFNEYIQKQKKNHKKIDLTLVDWNYISMCQKLSEEFIEKHSAKVNWNLICWYQKLSEEFIEKHSENVDWYRISRYQKLSEEFIEKHYISWNQKLSESFIEKHSKKVNWHYISASQKLSEEFIEKHSAKVYWHYISKYQKLTEEFIEKYKDRLSISSDSWMYKSGDEKLKVIQDSGKYKIEGDYIYAYKGIRSNRYSKVNFQYQYFVGDTYTCHADHNPTNENSFGLSAWTLEGAREYCKELIVLVKIHKNDLAALVHNSNKIRCSKFTVVEDVERN